MHAGEEGDGGGAADKSVRQQSLAEEGDDEAQAREDVEREAAMAAAQKAEGTVHLDDQYAQVENAPGPLYPPTHSGTDLDVIQFGDYPADYGPHTAVRLRSQDTIVPVKLVQMSTYPIIPMQDEEGVSEHVHGDPGKPITANVLFGACLPSRLSTQPPPSPSFALFVCRPLYPPLYPPVPTISQSLLSLPFHPLRIPQSLLSLPLYPFRIPDFLLSLRCIVESGCFEPGAPVALQRVKRRRCRNDAICMYACMCVVCVFIYLSIYLSIFLSIFRSIQIYIYRRNDADLSPSIYLHIYVYIYMYIYVYIYVRNDTDLSPSPTGKALRENGLGDGEYVETVAGGLGANSEAPIDRMYDMATEDKSGVDDGTFSRVSFLFFRPHSSLFSFLPLLIFPTFPQILPQILKFYLKFSNSTCLFSFLPLLVFPTFPQILSSAPIFATFPQILRKIPILRKILKFSVKFYLPLLSSLHSLKFSVKF